MHTDQRYIMSFCCNYCFNFFRSTEFHKYWLGIYLHRKLFLLDILNSTSVCCYMLLIIMHRILRYIRVMYTLICTNLILLQSSLSNLIENKELLIFYYHFLYVIIVQLLSQKCVELQNIILI